ncbi:MAG: hypothetical protein KDB14_05745 [Planctomycetales bacterium]|nr:hypothetical protein [Planctomycetales bacterium]
MRVMLLLVVLWILGTESVACGQPIGSVFTTVESRVAAADHVVLATIEALADCNRPADPGRHYAVTLKVHEVIKGAVPARVDNLQPVRLIGHGERYDQWKEHGTMHLCFLKDDSWGLAPRSWTRHRLGKPVPAEKTYVQYPLAPTFDQNLSVLKTEEEVLDRAREYARESLGERPVAADVTVSIRMPQAACVGLRTGSWNDVVLPVDRSLEKLAQRLIRAPEQFLPGDAAKHPFVLAQLRACGVQCLRFFPADTNIGLLRDLMVQSRTAFEADANFMPLRIESLETLLNWGVDLELPKFADGIGELHLAGLKVNDRTLGLVGRMRNLVRLQLRDSEITAAGLRKLSELRHLRLLDLSDKHLTDDCAETLREMGMLFFNDTATTEKDVARPGSVDDVVSLTLHGCPLTDAGIQQFAEFKNVVYLDLRSTKVTSAGIAAVSDMKLQWLHLEHSALTDDGLQAVGSFRTLRILGLGGLPITDAGLKHLVTLKQLTHLRLGGTKVTAEGIADLQRALPKCKIMLDDPHR